jgi:hypothetical protein
MPKKTKAQKIAAYQRKKQFTSNPTPLTAVQEPIKIGPQEHQAIMNLESIEDSRLKRFFVFDLRKSIFLITAITSIEILLYIIKR